jgi:hypothetical protein
LGENYQDIVECLNLLRENKEDIFFDYYKEKKQLLSIEKYDFLFCEMMIILKNKTNIFCFKENDFLKEYIFYLIKNILKILKYQSSNGICIIQINHISHKPIIELIYLITSLFEKTYIIKPNSSNITSFDKYLVCKTFIFTEERKELYKKYYKILKEIIVNYEKNIISILNDEKEDLNLPYYFMNKIDDINIIIGQQQLECMDQIIHMFKNNNQKERMELIRKINIQKSVHWCEKFKIPCNKFVEKTNIFLPVMKED